MSVEKLPNPAGPLKWRARWRDSEGEHSKRTRTKEQADLLDAKIKEAKAIGDIAFLRELSYGSLTFAEFIEERWWASYGNQLSADSIRVYSSMLRCHIIPSLGAVRFGEMTPEHIERLKVSLAHKNLAPGTIRKTLVVVQGMLQKAVEWGLLRQNPAVRVAKPAGAPLRAVTPLTPERVEAIRRDMTGRGRITVSLVYMTGIRPPKELLGLAWENVRESTILIPASIAKGRKERTVPLWGPLRDDLEAWREECEDPDGAILSPWRRGGYETWTRDHFPAGMVPYDLRHSYISLLIQAGVNIKEIARRAGHGAKLTLETYGHLFDEFGVSERIDPEALIYEAREALPLHV